MYTHQEVTWEAFSHSAAQALENLLFLAKQAVRTTEEQQTDISLVEYQKAYRSRMSRVGAMIRSRVQLEGELEDAKRQIDAFASVRVDSRYSLPRLFAARHLVLSHYVYLSAILEYMSRGGGSRGSALVVHPEGQPIHRQLEPSWKYLIEHEEDRKYIISTRFDGERCFFETISCRPIPDEDFWFETVWRAFLKGEHLTTTL